MVQGYTKLFGSEHPEPVKASERLKAMRTIAMGQADIGRDHDDGDGSSDGGRGNDGDGQ